jgi:Tfp pilus assembly protein PilO
MGKTRAGGWIAGTIVLVLAMSAAIWFLVAQARFESAAATTLEVQDTRARNDLLRVQLAKLKEDFERLDEYKAELATLRTQVPSSPDLSGYTRALDSLAAANGVTIVDQSPGISEAVVVVGAATDAPATDTSASTDGSTSTDAADSTSEGAATVSESAASPVPDGMVAVPMSFRVLGTYDGVSAFLAGVQQGLPRLFLVTALDGTSQDAADAGGGRPAVADGDLELNVTGYLYVLVDQTTVVEPGAEEPTETPALPSSPRNPFLPLPGTVE